ncbi:MAG: hypothetical protein M1821_008882 [Bathelium mastoideum]|nr:MAG: hypothetical protein M1821_008882 [Bathelium mastoideum]
MLRVPSPAEERQSRDYIFSPQVSKEELMEALHNLPSIHTSALDLLAAVVDRLGPSLMSTTSINYISQLARLFDTERQDLYLRAQSYRLVRMIIEQTGPALHQNFTRSLSTIMMECSTDCLSPIQSLDHNTSQDSKTNPTQTEPNSKKIPKELQEEASALLTTLLSKLPRNSVSIGTRARLDQAAVLSCNQEALAASVLNPGARSSMLPFLTRAFSSTAECEAILRPRFPPLTDGLGGLDGTSEEGIEDEGQIEETDADVNEEDDAEQDPGTLSTTNAHNLVERKRKVDGVEDVPSQPPAPNATGSHQEPVARPEQPQVSDRASASENVDDTAYEAHDVQAQTSSWPSKRVRFSDPEAQTLGHATSSAHNSHLEQQALVSRQITVFTAEPTVDEAATPIDDRSTGETEGEEDEDEFEVPALTMEQDTADEEE